MSRLLYLVGSRMQGTFSIKASECHRCLCGGIDVMDRFMSYLGKDHKVSNLCCLRKYMLICSDLVNLHP